MTDIARELHDVIQKWASRGYIIPEIAQDIEDDLAGVIRPALHLPHLPYVLLPVRDEYGTCHQFKLSRSNGKHLSRVDLDAIRAALGQHPLDEAEYPTFLHEDEWLPA